jgi:hypothetical protein
VKSRTHLPTLLLLLLPALACAAEAPDCRNGLFPEQVKEPGLARITPGPKVDVLGDTNGCPGPDPKCRDGSTLAAGETVLTGQRFGEYVCVFRPDNEGGNAGYVQADRLAAQTLKAPSLRDWPGLWRDGDNELRLSSAKGSLKVQGRAWWPARKPPKGAGGPNEGRVTGEAKPDGRRLVVTDTDDDDCVLTLTQVGPFLMASDTGYCGGHNVRFNGVFRKR